MKITGQLALYLRPVQGGQDGPEYPWARGYFVSTVGIDEEVIKRYVKYQENEEKRIESQQHKFDF